MAKKSINIRAGFDLKAFSTSSQNLARQLRSSGNKMQSIGRSMSMSLSAPIVALGGLAVKTFADFQQSMAKVQAISGATGDELKNLTNLAKQLGITTRFSATEVSDLMLNYSKLGFSSEQIEKITGATLNLALATGEDLAQSAEVAGSTLRAFGLEADQMKHLTDVMALSFSKSALDLGRFQDSMKFVAPVAKSANISLEETTSMLSVLANNGIKGSQAGTSLRRIISELGATGKPTSQALKELAERGLNLADAKDEVGRSAQSALLVLSAHVDEIEPLTQAYKDAINPAQEMANIMDQTLEGSMMRLKSATQGLAIEFGEVMAPAIGDAADFLGGLALMFANINPNIKKVIVVVGGLLAVIGPLILAVGGLTAAFAFLAANPIILIITGIIVAIGGLVAIILYVRDNFDAFADYFYNLWVRIANSAIDKIKGIAKGLSWLAGKFGLDLGIDAFFDKFKLKPKQATKEIKSFGETLKKVKEQVSAFTLADRGDEKNGTTTGETKTPEKLLTEKESNKKVSTLKAEINDIMKGFQPEIIPVVKVDKIEEGLNKPEVKSKLKKMGENLSQSFNQGLQSLVAKGVSDLGQLLGDTFTSKSMMNDQLKQTENHYNKLIEAARQNGEDISKIEQEKADKIAKIQEDFSVGSKVENFGRGLLDSIGKFMGQFGEAMIAMGIAQAMLKASIKTMNPAVAILGGIALVAAGAAISNLSKKGIDTGGGGGGNVPAPSMAGGGMGAMNTQPIALETKISGRDLILVQNREKGFTR